MQCGPGLYKKCLCQSAKINLVVRLITVVIINPPSEAMGGYTKSIQGLDIHFSTQNDQNNHLAIMKLIHFPDTHDQKWGVQNDRLDKAFKTEPDKKNIFSF